MEVLKERVAARRRVRDYYQEQLGGIPGISLLNETPTGRSNCWLTVIQVDPVSFGVDREAIRLALAAEDIESRPIWKPLHLQPAFRGCRSRGGDVAEALFQQGLCLPSGSAMTDDDLERVVRCIQLLQVKRSHRRSA